jgi:hypothetical protein
MGHLIPLHPQLSDDGSDCVRLLLGETMKRTLVTIFAVLLISAMPAGAGDIARWQCGKTVVQVYVEYSPENSMGGDSPEPTYTLRFENPPKGHVPT